MKNIALKMYSRGMLNNSSDYTEDATGNNTAQIYGSRDRNRITSVRKAAGITRVSYPAQPTRSPAGFVPAALGLSLREAVVELERYGYNVKFHGAGYVRQQTPPAGAELEMGETVVLSLAP